MPFDETTFWSNKKCRADHKRSKRKYEIQNIKVTLMTENQKHTKQGKANGKSGTNNIRTRIFLPTKKQEK